MARIQVISGGQTGVDQAALRAAKRLGIRTGGLMPLGWTTEVGPRPDFAELYGMSQHVSPGYPARTWQNVRDANMTIWYGPTGSRGCAATCKFADRELKHISFAMDGDQQELSEFILRMSPDSDPVTLNCAGNRESGNPGIGEKAEAYFLSLFEVLLASKAGV